jgi:hypothetical protein
MNANESDEKSSNTPAKSTISSSNWAFGLAVIVIGCLLLARNLGIELFFLDFHNWWAFFILAAAINPLFNAWKIYQTQGFTQSVFNSLISGGTIVFIALVFLLDLSLGVWWPSFIIIGGLYMLTNK